MDFIIRYAIKNLLLPLSSLLILSFLGLFLLRRREYAVLLIYFSLTTLLVLSLPITIKYFATNLETHPPLKLSSLDDFDAQAIVILGGGIRGRASEYGQQATLNSDTLTRVRYGAFLAKQINLPILVSGGKVFDDGRPSEAEIMSAVLNNEFNQKVQWQEQKSRNTAGNALYTSKILGKEGITHILLVTQAYHMPRAVEHFQQYGLHVLPAPTDFISGTGSSSLLNFIPSANALARNSMFIHEIMGRVWMRVVNYMK